jgi:hypothetical protein
MIRLEFRRLRSNALLVAVPARTSSDNFMRSCPAQSAPMLARRGGAGRAQGGQPNSVFSCRCTRIYTDARRTHQSRRNTAIERSGSAITGVTLIATTKARVGPGSRLAKAASRDRASIPRCAIIDIKGAHRRYRGFRRSGRHSS